MKPNLKFIHHGAKVYWNDPANADYGEFAEDHAATVYVVHSVNGSTSGVARESDDVILIYDPARGYGEAEVPACELKPYVPQYGQGSNLIRMADAFLLSTIKYADRRMKKAEAKAKDMREEMLKLLSVSKHDIKAFKKDDQFQKMAKALDEANRRLRIYEDYYLSHREPAARSLRDLAGGPNVQNTPDALARFLMRCPETEPLASDPDVRIVAEDSNGQTVPVINAWYNEQNGTVRLTVDTTFKD